MFFSAFRFMKAENPTSVSNVAKVGTRDLCLITCPSKMLKTLYFVITLENQKYKNMFWLFQELWHFSRTFHQTSTYYF